MEILRECTYYDDKPTCVVLCHSLVFVSYVCPHTQNVNGLFFFFFDKNKWIVLPDIRMYYPQT